MEQHQHRSIIEIFSVTIIVAREPWSNEVDQVVVRFWTKYSLSRGVIGMIGGVRDTVMSRTTGTSVWFFEWSTTNGFIITVFEKVNNVHSVQFSSSILVIGDLVPCTDMVAAI